MSPAMMPMPKLSARADRRMSGVQTEECLTCKTIRKLITKAENLLSEKFVRVTDTLLVTELKITRCSSHEFVCDN